MKIPLTRVKQRAFGLLGALVMLVVILAVVAGMAYLAWQMWQAMERLFPTNTQISYELEFTMPPRPPNFPATTPIIGGSDLGGSGGGGTELWWVIESTLSLASHNWLPATYQDGSPFSILATSNEVYGIMMNLVAEDVKNCNVNMSDDNPRKVFDYDPNDPEWRIDGVQIDPQYMPAQRFYRAIPYD